MSVFLSDGMFNFIRQSEANKASLMEDVENRVRHGDSPRSALKYAMQDLRLSSSDFSDPDWKEIQREVEKLYLLFNV